MEWVEIKIADILAHMPTDVKARYGAWLIANPDRTGRLVEIMDNTLREFRDNLNSVPENNVDPRETWVPQSAVRHLETIIIFSLSMEMGLPIDSAALGARYAADIFLRQILMGRYKVTTDTAGTPSPHYSVPERDTISGRALPILLALLLFAQQALGGWIRPDSGPLDTDVVTTFTPTAYSITTATLFGHLQGINAALGPLASTNYVNAAVAAVSLTNTVDATARALATSASITANAALNSLSGYLPLSGGTHLTMAGPIDMAQFAITNVSQVVSKYSATGAGEDLTISGARGGTPYLGGRVNISGGYNYMGTVMADILLRSPTTAEQGLTVYSSLTVRASASIASNLVVSNAVAIGGTTTIGGPLTVTNTAIFKNNMSIASNLTVTGKTTMAGGFEITLAQPPGWSGYIKHDNWETVFMAPRYEYYSQGVFKFMGPAEWGWTEDQTNLYVSGSGVRVFPTLYARNATLTGTLDMTGNAITNAGTLTVSNVTLGGVSRSNWPVASSGPVSNIVAQSTASTWDPATGTLGLNTNDACRVSAGTLAPFHGTFNPAATAGTPYYFDTHGELAPQSGNNSSLRGFVVPWNYRITGASLTRRVGGTYGVSNAAPVAIMLYNKTLDQYSTLFPDVGYGMDFPPPMATNNLNIMLWASNEYSVAMSRVAWTTAPTSVRNVVILYIDKE